MQVLHGIIASSNPCPYFDLKFTSVRILLYVGFLEVSFYFSLERIVQINTNSEASINSLAEETFLLPLKFSIPQTRIPNDGVFRIVTTTVDE